MPALKANPMEASAVLTPATDMEPPSPREDRHTGQAQMDRDEDPVAFAKLKTSTRGGGLFCLQQKKGPPVWRAL